LQILDFNAGDADSATKLIGTINSYIGKNAVILLLDMDTSMLNIEKQAFIFSISKRQETIFFSNDQKSKKLQLLANPADLKTFLEVIRHFKLA
jgi:hypothetical protein